LLKGLKERQASLLTPRFRDLHVTTQLDAGGAPRSLWVHAALAMPFLEHLAMERDLAGEIAIATPESQDGDRAREQFPDGHGCSSVAPSNRAMMPAIRFHSSASRCS
jgi:hypothetical protein